MTECSETLFPFEVHFSRQVVAQFEGSWLTTEGGSLLLRQADGKIGLLRRVVRCFTDYRRPATAAIFFFSGLRAGRGPAKSRSRRNRMGGVSSRDHPITTAEDRRPGAYHRAKDLGPLCEGLPLEEGFRLGLGSATLLKNLKAKNSTPGRAAERSRAPQVFPQDESRLAAR